MWGDVCQLPERNCWYFLHVSKARANRLGKKTQKHLVWSWRDLHNAPGDTLRLSERPWAAEVSGGLLLSAGLRDSEVLSSRSSCAVSTRQGREMVPSVLHTALGQELLAFLSRVEMSVSKVACDRCFEELQRKNQTLERAAPPCSAAESRTWTGAGDQK
jgi:hypothetical protein